MENNVFDSFKEVFKKIKVKLSDSEIKRIVGYIDDNASPEEFGVFVTFGKEMGMPCTLGAARMGLSLDGLSTEEILSDLKQAKVISSEDVPGGMIKKFVSRDWKEDQNIKKRPLSNIEVFDYDEDFVRELGSIFSRVGFKSEEVSMNPLLQMMREEIERINVLNGVVSETHHDDEADEGEMDFFHHLDNEAIEKFSDGLLLILGELEAEGKIPKFDSAKDAKVALMATIRKLYQSRSTIGKMARKYQRFGAQRVLRRARRELSKAQSSR